MAESSIRVDGSKVKAARDAKGWSQKTLAARTGYKISVIQKLEQGTFYSEPCLARCAEVLGVPAADLLLTSPRPGEIRRGPDEDLPPSGPTVYRGPAELHELRALDNFGRIQELSNPCFYEIEDATLTIRGTEAHLIIEKVTMYDDDSCSKKRSSHRLEGCGPYVRDSASIQYTVKDQRGRLSWAGLCFLTVPPTGKIHGYWMAAGHKERGRTVLGTLELDPNPLVKSSEEAGGHDQREG